MSKAEQYDQPPLVPDTKNSKDALKKLSEELSVNSDFGSQPQPPQFKIPPQADCPSSSKAAVTLDNIGDWFAQNAKIYDRDGDKALSTWEMRGALRTRCIPAQDAGSLKLILDNQDFFAEVDYDYAGDQKKLTNYLKTAKRSAGEKPVFVSDKDMSIYDGWRQIAKDDMQKFKELDPAAYNSMTFLKEHFSTLDADKSGKITPEELDGAIKSGRFHGKDLYAAQMVASNFEDITDTAHPRGRRTRAFQSLFGWEQPISRGTIASYVMERNDELDSLGESFKKLFSGADRYHALKYYDYPKLPGAAQETKPQGD